MVTQILIREATEADREQIERLFQEGFGNIANRNGALSCIEGQYAVAELHKHYIGSDDESEIVAVSGIRDLDHSDFKGYEINWTCTTKEYRKQGLIVQILKKCMDSLKDDGMPLYCDCWKVGANDISMKSVMKHLGMHKVVAERIKRDYSYSTDCSGCPYEDEECFCCVDLYMRNR